MKKLIYYLILGILISCSLGAQEQMSLEKAISIGLENHYGIQVADRYIFIAENNNTWARAGKLPIIDLNTNFTNTITDDNNPASFLKGTYYVGSLSASADAQWVVFNGGRVGIAKEQLASLVDQQKLNRDTEIHNLLRIIYQQYYNVLFQQAQLEVIESNLQLSKDRLAYEETRRSFGASNSYNLIQFENAVITDSTNQVSQLQLIETSKRNLYTTLNIIGFANYDFPEKLSITPEEIDEAKLQEVLSEENYTLKSLSMIAALDRINTRLEETSRKPNISLTGSLGLSQNGFQFYADDPNTGEPFDLRFSNRLNGSIGANLNWNLYDGGVRKANIENARIQEDIDQLNILEAQAELQNQLGILVGNYDNQRDILRLTDDQIRIALSNLEMTEERFKAGQLSSLDFRNVQIQYLNSAFNKVNAIYNLIITKSEIDYLVGTFN